MYTGQYKLYFKFFLLKISLCNVNVMYKINSYVKKKNYKLILMDIPNTIIIKTDINKLLRK